MSRIVVLVLVVLAVATPSAGVAQQPIQVFLLAGQSNMLGRAMPISGGTGATANLRLYRDGAWGAAADPLGPLGKSNGVGPGMTFGVGVLSHSPPGTTVGLIMCALSSTSISDWRPGESPYNSCRRKASEAGGVVAGIVFLQGEREALEGGGDRWASGFAKTEPAFEHDFGPVPFVLGQIGTLDPAGRPYQQEVRDAQAAAAARYPEVTLVTSTDLPVTEGVHFTLAAVKTLGTRYANAWYTLSLQFPSLTDVSPVTGAPGVSVTLTGKGLGSVSGVKFGGSGPASYTIDNPNKITAIVPDSGLTGPIKVTSPRGTLDGPTFAVLPTVTSFSPTSGLVGSRLVVTGKALGGTTAVTLNGVDAKFKILSSTQLQVKVPKATTGKIAVTTSGGTAQSVGTFTVG